MGKPIKFLLWSASNKSGLQAQALGKKTSKLIENKINSNGGIGGRSVKVYFEDMHQEFESINSAIDPYNKNLLSIGGGLGGLELVINKKFNVKSFTFIERNYVSKKVKYGWDNKNNEAYNDLIIQRNFLIKNGMESSKFKIFDYDNDELPKGKFDIIISLFSLDYHYDFKIYLEYLKDNTHTQSKIILDTIRPDYFKNIFKEVVILKDRPRAIHGSKRIMCSDFLK